MVLTERDKEIIRQVYYYRLMTREQIERLLFPPERGQDHPTKTSICQKRLRFLYQHGYLERIPIPVNPGFWVWMPVYRLAPKGAELIAAELGTTSAKLSYWGKGFDKDHRPTEVSLLFLDHTLKINDIRVAITLAARKAGYRIEKWLDETQLKSQEMKDYVTITSQQGRKLKVAVVPDAYFILHLGDRRAHFFLELDQATMTSKRWKTRILAYKAYTESGKYQERYQTQSLRVLTVTTTPERLANLKTTTERAGGGRLFWFTTFPEATTADIILSPIWRVAGQLPSVSLIS
jgi:hypothetical protein